ncbi:alpha-1,2-mannosidase, putative subfamily [Microthyrium microscopicum]|uniref:Alpha-1,2-mannosidase, putative subfamily n=1 Tax=Microthyrium microscopicum TaxID=703497 RepID=A0A6A6UK83_9PEZI|nr:alpha-1,2-mannosidase, putative subfamily [Microthyrium microscopicum]
MSRSFVQHGRILALLVSCLLYGLVAGQTPFNVLDFVDPLIGTAAGGHVFPGATMPFGMAKPVADVLGENQGGFSTDSSAVYGFSHMHDSGTGGSPSMGNFPIWPQIGCVNDDIQRCALERNARSAVYLKDSVVSKPGYFALSLDNAMTAEMTATNRTALYRFGFPGVIPKDNTTQFDGFVYSPTYAIDLTDLPNTRKDGGAKIDFATGRITTSGTFNPSFGIGTYASYACFDFKGAKIRDAGVWKAGRAGVAPEVRVVPDGVNTNGGTGLSAGAWIRFNQTAPGPTNMTVRVGVSFISEEKACRNAETEIPDFDFAKVRRASEEAWKVKLSPISVDSFGINTDLQKSFWSGLYRNFISPQDYTGENPLWKSDEPYYDSYYCIWDSYRSMHQLITLIDPHSQTLMIRSLIDIYRHEGWLPDCRMSLCKGFTQGGSNADTLLVDSWIKGISDGVDWKTAYEAMIKDAEVEPLNWSVEGRGGLRSWKTLGYIPKDDFDPIGSGAFTRSISRTVEYAYNDYNIALMAQATGKLEDAEKYFKRSHNWKNLFKPDQNSTIRDVDTGFRGFLQPKAINGSWEYQDPIVCSHELNFDGCYLNPQGTETYEGSPWMYTFYVPGDMAELIKRLGGPDTFVRRLDFYHETQIQYIGDEQAFLLVYLYHYAGRPAMSAQRAHFYIPSFFTATNGGLPGNDDSGAMGSFVVLTMLGIFPNPGQNVYFIIPPFFPCVNITNPVSGKTATIRNINFDPAYRNIYIQSATLNGKPYTKNWITHDLFLHGGVLELTLGSRESEWGTKPEDRPPSLSTSGFVNKTMSQQAWLDELDIQNSISVEPVLA